MYSPKSPHNGMLHLMPHFNEQAALDYMHTEISLESLRTHADDYVYSQPLEVVPMFQERLLAGDSINNGRSHPLLFTILGLMILQEQAVIDDISAASIQQADLVLSKLSTSPGGRVIVAKAAIQLNCQPYYNMMNHVVTQHTPQNLQSMYVWSGLQKGYIIGNQQKQIDDNPAS